MYVWYLVLTCYEYTLEFKFISGSVGKYIHFTYLPTNTYIFEHLFVLVLLVYFAYIYWLLYTTTKLIISSKGTQIKLYSFLNKIAASTIRSKQTRKNLPVNRNKRSHNSKALYTFIPMNRRVKITIVETWHTKS